MAAHAPPEASHPGTAATPDEPPPVQLPYNVAKADAGAASPSPADTADDEGDDAVGALSPKSMRKKKGKGAGIDKQKRASSSWFSTKKKRLVAMPQEYDDILCQVRTRTGIPEHSYPTPTLPHTRPPEVLVYSILISTQSSGVRQEFSVARIRVQPVRAHLQARVWWCGEAPQRRWCAG